MMRKIVSIVLKSIVVLSAIVGVALSFRAGGNPILYFTIQSNIWIAAVCLVGLVLMVAKVEIKPWMYLIKLIFTVSITLTGVVFCVMLAPLLGKDAYALNNTLTHVVVPAVAVADFFVSAYPAKFKKWHCLLVTVPPFYYLGFAGIGYALNWDFGNGVNYPYFFLNWGNPAGVVGFSKEFPYIGVLYYILILLVFVVGVGALYMWIASVIRRKTTHK